MSGEIQIGRTVRYTTIDNPILYDKRIGKNELLVYLVLSRFANGNSKAWPTGATIAELSRIGRSTVFAALESLETIGYLTRDSGAKKGIASRYFLVDQYEVPGIPTDLSPNKKVAEGCPGAGRVGVQGLDGGCPGAGHITLPYNTPNKKPIEHKGLLEGESFKNKGKKVFGQCENVFLFESELSELEAKYQDKTFQAIEYLSTYKKMHNKNYASDYGALENWVFDAMAEKAKRGERELTF